MPQSLSKSSMNGFKAFAFATKISNCPQFATSGKIGDKISQIRKKLASGGVKITKSPIFVTICFISAPQSIKVKYEWI